MKQVILILIAIIYSFEAFGQFQNFENCKEAKSQAIIDSNNGILTSRIHGLVDMDFSDSQKYYEIYLYSKYNIEISYEGCIVSDEDICYTKAMDSIIDKKFGNKFLEKVKTEAKVSFDSNQKKDEILDLNKTYFDNYLESHPKFIGNDKVISDYLKSIIKNTSDSPLIFNSILLKIDTNGKVTDIVLNEHNKFKENTNRTDAIKHINSLGNWVPGFIYERKVISLTFFMFD